MVAEEELAAHGPHGGPFVETAHGYVELSVYETGIPPHFRLYFFDKEKRPQGVPGQTAVTIETVRPDGERHIFEFEQRAAFLQSTTNIPEPHEFDVLVKVAKDGETHTYPSKFTEDGHAHGPGGHHHNHGNGILGWLRGTFAHSHSVVEKVDNSLESNEAGIRALKISLVGLGITALFQLAIVLISGSVGLLADTIHNFADAGTSLPLWVAFSLTKRGASRRFTYGYGKTEDVAGVAIVFIIFFSACVALWESVRKLIHPMPVGNLWWVAAAAVVGFIGNEAVAVFRIRVGTQIGSAALVADGQHARVDGFTSLAVLIGVIGVWFGFPILDPVIGILITIAILFIVKDAARSVWNRLIDGIEPEILAEIEHAPTHVPGVKSVERVRARWIGHRVYSDVEVIVDSTITVEAAHLIAEQVERSMREHVRLLGEAVVRVSPAPKPI
jgi:cation diffusion facilitator family transporter